MLTWVREILTLALVDGDAGRRAALDLAQHGPASDRESRGGLAEGQPAAVRLGADLVAAGGVSPRAQSAPACWR